MTVDVAAIRRCKKPGGMPFALTKLGHVVLNCSDLERSVRFYTESWAARFPTSMATT